MSNNINIILNSSNYDTSKKQFSYKLTIPQRFENKRVGLAYCSIYKQWDNISSSYGNNKFTITWIDNSTWNFTIPDGNYSIAQINEYISYVLYQNKLYCTNTSNSTQASVNLEIVVNPTLYGSQINAYPILTSANATASGLAVPSGASWSFPTTAKCPSITFTSGFGSLFGFSAGTYGGGSASQSFNSNLCPQIALVNSLILRTNLINNQIITPNDVLGAMPLDGEYGSLLKFQNSMILYSNISSNNFSEIIVYFSDQNLNKLSIKDTEVCIVLSIVDL